MDVEKIGFWNNPSNIAYMACWVWMIASLSAGKQSMFFEFFPLAFISMLAPVVVFLGFFPFVFINGEMIRQRKSAKRFAEPKPEQPVYEQGQEPGPHRLARRARGKN